MAAKTSTGWYHLSDPAANLVQLSRWITKQIFATEEGGYGMALRLRGVDVECVSEQKLSANGASILQAERGIADEVSLFQIWWKRRTSGVYLSRFAEESESEAVRETEEERNEFLRRRTLYEVSAYWVLYVRQPKLKAGSKEAIHARSQKMLRALHSAAANLMSELMEFDPSYLSQAETLSVFHYMANLEPDAPVREPRSQGGLAGQICETQLEWHRYGLIANKNTTTQRFIQPFSLIKRPAWTAPGMLAGLLSVPGEILLVLECQRRSAAAVRSVVGSLERFMEFFRANPLVRFLHRNKVLPKTAASAATDANLEIGGLGGIIQDVSHRGLTYCDVSLIGLVHSKSEAELPETMAAVHRVFGTSEAKLEEEGIGALAAYIAMFPGAVIRNPILKWVVESMNVRRRKLREDHVANMSLYFSVEQGSKWSDTLEDECVLTLETRAGTAYYWDQFASGPRGVIVTGEPRRGKTFYVSLVVDHEAKYGGYIFIWDKGGSYENVVLKHGGTVVKVGLKGPRFGLFCLPNAEDNWNNTAQLIMLLLKRSGARIGPKDELNIRDQVAAIYDLDDWRRRRLSSLHLSQELQPYLEKWIGRGVYSAIFDNAQDDIQLSRIISFDFQGLTDADREVLMQPLVFWLSLRINSLVRSEGNLTLPKLNVFDEVHQLIEDENILRFLLEGAKTHGKMLGGLILATQDTRDLGPHAGIIRNACPDAVFLGGAFDRDQYVDLYEMKDRELDLIPTLQRGECLAVRRGHSKVLRIAADEKSTWLYTTHPQDVRRRLEAIKEHGRDKAFEVLAQTAKAK